MAVDSTPTAAGRLTGVASAVAGLAGALTLPIACFQIARWLEPDPLWVIAALPWAAALNAYAPLGGGMVVDGTYRDRLGPWGVTFDAAQGVASQLMGVFVLALVTIGGFVVALPLVALADRLLGVTGHLSPSAMTAAGAVLAVAISLLRHRAEHPLSAWAADGNADLATLGERVRVLARLQTASGLIGHTGGLGAEVAGLHEHVPALEILRRAEGLGIPGAAELSESARRALRQQALPGDEYAVYPGGRPRAWLTEQARAALLPPPAEGGSTR